jgi:hypothetical protein
MLLLSPLILSTSPKAPDWVENLRVSQSCLEIAYLTGFGMAILFSTVPTRGGALSFSTGVHPCFSFFILEMKRFSPVQSYFIGK